jgi:hypothetical protein
MKTAIILILISLLRFGNVNESLDKANGFSKYQFGSSISEYADLKLLVAEGNLKSFLVSAPATINGIELAYIRLTFYNDKLSDIAMCTKNKTGEKLLRFFQDKYGSTKANDKMYEWSGQKVKLIYELVNHSKDAEIFFYDLN